MHTRLRRLSSCRWCQAVHAELARSGGAEPLNAERWSELRLSFQAASPRAGGQPAPPKQKGVQRLRVVLACQSVAAPPREHNTVMGVPCRNAAPLGELTIRGIDGCAEHPPELRLAWWTRGRCCAHEDERAKGKDEGHSHGGRVAA
jgi:hypothetical protein